MRAVEKRGLGTWLVGAAALVAATASVTAPDRLAHAQPERRTDVEACFAAAESAQPLMKERKLRAAQRRLLACAREECPKAARNDCRTWLADVTRALPTVVFAAREEAPDGASRALEEVRVTVDGEVVATRLDGTAVPVDPGVHAVRFEHAGLATVEQRVDVREGESRREIDAVFRAAPRAEPHAGTPPAHDGTEGSPPPPPPPPPESTAPPEHEEAPSGRVPVAAYALGAAGIVSLGVGITMEVIGLTDRQHLSDTCRASRSCSQSDVDGARNRVMAGDIALGVSAILFASAAYVYFTRDRTPPPAGHALRVRLGGVGSGVGAGIEGSL